MPLDVDPNLLPKFNPSLTGGSKSSSSQPGPLKAGVGAGFHELVGLGGSAIQGLGKLAGSDTVANYGKSVADNQATIAARVGRPDLEVAPWQPGGASIAPWLEYQAAKMIPTLAGYAGAQFVPGVNATADAAGLARIGAILPEFLGGGGLEAGASFAARKAALETGSGLGRFVVGGGAFGAATGFGQAIQSADAAPGGVTASSAAQAAAESPLYAAAGLVEPGFLRGALHGAEGNLVTRVLARGLSGAAVGSVQAGTLTALDQTFRPDLSAQDKMANIVDAAVTGAAVGGVLAAPTGIRGLKRVDPNAIPTDGLGQVIDHELNLGDAGQAQNLGRLGLPAPPTFVDSMGRAAVGSGGDAQLRSTPVDASAPAPVEVPQAAPALFGPEGVPDRGTIPGSTIIVGRRSDGGRFHTDFTEGVEQPPVVPEDTSRAYRNLTTPELEAAANALMNKREATGKITPQLSEIAKGIDSELELRRNGALTTDVVGTPSAEAVSANANRRGTGEQSSAAPASVNDGDVAARITELTQGLKLPASLKDRLTQARSEHDIQDIVHDEIIVAGKGGKMRDALAQRVGMLDSEGRPTPMADEVSARKTPAGEEAPTPAADAVFLQRWKDDVKTTGQKDPAVRALKPTNEVDAQTQIYRALGEMGVKSDADGLEKLAQKYGVLDDSKQLTPLALEIAKKDPISTDDSVKAAQAQGFKGAAASMFDRGARAYTGDGDLITKFESSRAGEAYQAGVKWAEETNSVPKGALKKYEPSGYTGEVTDEQRALGAKAEVKKAVIPPDVRQGQLVNEAIDNVGLTPAKNEGDIAQLKSMVRTGDIEGAMEGLRRVQRGESLFDQPERAPVDFKGETVTRGAPRVEQTREVLPTKAASHAEALKLIEKYQVSRAVHSAFESGQIDAKERIRLLAKLNSGRVADVVKVVGTPSSRIIEAERLDSERPERRAENARQLQEMMEKAAREAEVPEMQVDKNGILRARLKDERNQLARNADMFAAISLHRDNPKAIIDHLENEGGAIGEMTKRFRKYLPDDLKFVLMHSDKMEQIGHENGWNLPPAAFYDFRSHTVAIDANETYPQYVLHELGHAVIDGHIYNRTPIGREIESVFHQLKDLIPEGDYAATNADEFMAEFLSRKDLRDYIHDVAEFQQTGRKNLFQRLWDVILKAFGKAPRPLVEHILDLAEAAGGQRLYPSEGLSPMIAAPPKVAAHVKDTVGSIVDAVDKHVDIEGAKGVLRRSQLYATTVHHITEFYGRPWFGITREDGTKVNGVVQREHTIDFKEAIQQRHAQLIDDAMNRVYELANQKEGKKSFENINRLMQLTQFGIHPGREWDQQIKEVQNNPSLKKLVEEGRNMYRSLQAKGHVEIYDDLRKFNDVQMLAKTAMTLHDYVNTDRVMQGRIAEFADSPMRRFMNEQAREDYGLQEAHDFWNRELDNQTKALKDHADAFDIAPPKGSTSDHRQMSASMRTVREQINSVKAVRERLEAFPNFHLGRDGDYFVDMKLRLGKDGKVDPAAMAAAAERLKQYGYVVSPHSAADHVYFRVDSTVTQASLIKAAEALQRDGFVRSDVRDEAKGTTSHAIISGKRSDDRIQSRLADQWTNRLVQEIKANEHLQEKDREFLVKAIRAQALDLTPDNNLSKVMTHRDNVPGFDPDMFRSYNSRAKISVDALAGMAVARDITDSYTNMRLAQQQARVAPSSQVSIAQRNGMTDVIDELSRHDKNIANQSRSSKPLDQLQAVSGAFFLSANLAYPLVNLAQVPMIALPELGSKFGFLNAAKTLAGVTPEALRIVAAIAKNGLRVSVSRGADAVLTAKALKDAGVSGPKAEFLMQVANRGGVDIGGASRELARNAKGVRGSKVDQTLKIASALGYYSETLSRLVVALASHKLHPEGTSIDEMAQNTVRTLKESMWDYSSPNTSTMLSRDGFLGKMTPLATQFMKYTAMLNEKLYREVHAAVGGDAEARRFLLQHLAMTTVFAGTLGLPLAAVLASTYDRLKDWVDEGDQPSDIQASFRNGMADVFGKGAAEVLTRGASRAGLILPGLDVDLSTRLGEQNILPFSQFIADRRDLKSSLKDLESRAWGAPSSMMLNVATGAGRVAQGDFEGGFRQMLPLGLASMVKAYQMTDQGFTDSKGNVLPMTPSARDILAQATGFNPAQNAEYNEARSDQMQQQGLLSKKAGSLRSRIVDAVTTGDRDKARDLIGQAVEFDRANPAYGVLRGVESSIQRKQQQQVLSEKFGVPLGVNPKDVNAPRLTRYADVEYQAQ